ncbi:MEMAR_RS02690 family S-layer glycoprotein [Methanolacinia paynteri]|uniref:MEMAR_RS02690 family S-layer glycoprotein n=1 Tax=Methanolacinia paynteri TaxID=230356 RepID=UPI00064F1E59|nr:MEMAR_RS02690 family S-layer glycoprotein [Methanolacinia paynteri]
MTKKFALALVSLMVLAAMAVGSASAGVYAPNITTGDVIFVGESGLNIAPAMGNTSKLAWFASGSTASTDQPAIVYSVGDNGSFYVNPGMFSAYEGSWYNYTGAQPNGASLAFYVYVPTLDISIWDVTDDEVTDVTGKKVITGDNVTLRVDSNMYSLFSRNDAGSGINYSAGIDLNVITPSGATLVQLINASGNSTTITGVKPSSSQYYLISEAAKPTSGTQTPWQLSISRYSAGTYQVVAKSNVNGMKDNLGEITGETVSETGTIELDKDTVSITADKETVVRNNDFSVTIDGKPSTKYYVWISGTNSYNYGNGSGDTVTADIPPQFQTGQDDVTFLNNNISAEINTGLNYTYKSNTKMYSDVANNRSDVGSTATVDNPYAVEAKTGKDGTITIGITTAPNTKAATYTVRVESETDTQLYETVKVTVEKGSVTITASGDGSYYLGEQITFSGTDTDSDYVYLFITGPNLADNGANLATPSVAVVNENASSFVSKAVNVDNTWEYKLETSTIGLDAGTYTVYAVNGPYDKDHLSGTKYDTVSIVVKKPFVTATVSASTVAKGDKLYIRGTAEGNPTQGVAIWILGKNYWNGEATNSDAMVTETVNDDGSFEYEFGSGDTKNLASGQYFVVVQHPMYNDEFNVFTSGTNPTYVVEAPVASAYSATTNTGYNSEFVIWGGDNKLQGSDAAEALIEMIDSADIDDTYTKLTFLIEEPWIRINTVGDHYVGDSFTISGTTNLAVDDDLIVEVTSSSFTATQKSQSGEFSGQSETVKVVAGSTYNEWSMDVDASSFKADEYIVNVESIETTATATTTFNILTPGPSTPTPSATATSGPVTTTATATQATPTETAAPGFGALVALIGLGAVAALVLRKE